MGDKVTAPINEVVALQSFIDKEKLQALRHQYSSLGNALQEGVLAGIPDQEQQVLREKAQFVIDVLTELEPRCRRAVSTAGGRLSSESRIRLSSSIVSLIGSSSIIASLGLAEPQVAMIAGVITLLSSGLLTGADFLKFAPGNRKIEVSAIYERLTDALLQIQILRSELTILLRYDAEEDDLNTKVAEANSFCRDVNKEIGSLLLVSNEKAIMDIPGNSIQSRIRAVAR